MFSAYAKPQSAIPDPMVQFALDSHKLCHIAWLGQYCFELALAPDATIWLPNPQAQWGEPWYGET